MKHLKLFESFREEDIHAICEKYGIDNYTINEDGSIDVNGPVDLGSRKLNRLPLKFRKVTIYFDCSYNQLTSLEGCPESVGGSFLCDVNRLKSLEGCPKSVGGSFLCEYNQLASLEGCPESVSNFCCYGNPIYQIWSLFEDYDKIEFFNDCDPIRPPNIIILDRLNYFLEEIGKKTVTEVKGYKCI
jgi:hypothetical protein